MTRNSFIQNYDDSRKWLSDLELLRDFCKFDDKKSFGMLPDISLLSRDGYSNTVTGIRNTFDYSFMLMDDSIFQIGAESLKEPIKLKYTFMQNCSEVVPFEEEMPWEDFKDMYSEEEYLQEKESYYETGAYKTREIAFPFYIRYDYDESAYKCKLHPCSHLHLLTPTSGHLASNLIWSPGAFVSFCIRLAYRDRLSNDDYIKLMDIHKLEFSKCDQIANCYWTEEDRQICHLFQIK